MDQATSQFNLKEAPDTNTKPLDSESLAYQEEIAKACGIALGQRILTFKTEAPSTDREDLRTTWSRPLRPPNSFTAKKRRFKSEPDKILDAPGMSNDYYLNLLDWSSTNILAVALEDTVWIWNGNTGSAHELCKASGEKYVSSLQWMADGSYLAVGLSEGDVQLWSMETMSRTRTMRGRAARVGSLSWKESILSSGARDGSIWNHDVRMQNHKVAQLLHHESDVCGLKWRADGDVLASGGNDNQVAIWDARTNTPRFTKGEHMAAVKALAWCPWQLNILATGGGSHDKMIHFWNTSTGGKFGSCEADSQVTSIIWSHEYKEFVTSHGFPDNRLSLWKYPSLTKYDEKSEAHEERILHTALSPDGQTVATASADQSLKFWKVWESEKKKGKTDREVDEDLVAAYKRFAIR
ncbi:ubiquitin-protein transferase activating protein [Borealophlyctis nickersoniae]|nr:ubiquitin-protein transferase activating protein [Borealophlyctis nickersoniae]